MSQRMSASTAAQPDLDWSQVRETVLMLKLAAAQVEFSLKDGTHSVNVLTGSFTSMMESIKSIENGMELLSQKYQISEEDQLQVNQHRQQIDQQMQQAIVAFQFYDRLVQRLDHVVNGLSEMGELVADSQRIYSPHEWRALQEQIRGRYTMEKERALFDAILAGEDMSVVLERMHQVAEQDEDDIELF